TTKLRNDILMFQQHQGESLFEAWTHFKDLLQKLPHHGIDLWLQVQIFYDHVNPATRRTIDQSVGGTDNQEKNEKQSQNNKTGLGMEKTVKDKAKSKSESRSSQKVNIKVNWSKSTQVNPGAKVKEI
ncbi:hypothetical protein Tco_0418077, partial [Tanacetum coccineum]